MFTYCWQIYFPIQILIFHLTPLDKKKTDFIAEQNILKSSEATDGIHSRFYIYNLL
jgi:hypothetical protein